MRTPDPAGASGPVNGCRAREVLDRVGDKWSLSVIHMLGGGTRRFSDLRRGIDGISQRMLTVTLRGLERDGLVDRTVHPTVPPRVEYALSPMGRTLLEPVCNLVHWAHQHLADIDSARAAYDHRSEALNATVNGHRNPQSAPLTVAGGARPSGSTGWESRRDP
jgi:DNA-binding HxlR family transcriptional regulator